MTDLDLVRSELAIRGLIERYSDACCRRDAAALMELWAEDCSWSVPDMDLVDVRGKDRIREIWESAQELFPFAFLICVPGAIDIDGDAATARSYTSEVLENQEGAVRQAVGRYDDRFARVEGKWLFTERVWHMMYHL